MIKQLLFILCALTGSGLAAQISGTITHSGLTREYIMDVPPSYVAGTATPLVFNLHGYGSDHNQQRFYSLMTNTANAEGFIVVYPLGTDDGSGSLFWNAFGGGGPDDVGFIEALIDSLSTQYTIDPQRVYSCGMSNGGFMSYKLACESSRFAAVASVTGSMTTTELASCTPSIIVPAMQIHGTNDATVPYNGGGGFATIENVVAKWVTETNSNTTPTVTSVPDLDPGDGATAEHYVYSGGSNGASVEFYKVTNGTHTWPDAPINLGITCNDFNATEEIWRFFNQYTLGGFLPSQAAQETYALAAFPNPTQGIISFDIPFSGALKITDLQGKVLKLEALNDVSTLDLSGFENGIYIIQIETQTEVFISRIIKAD